MIVQTALVMRIRPAVPQDMDACAKIDHSIDTDYVWQMEYVDREGSHYVTFRTVRLPRSMRVRYPRGSSALRQSWEAGERLLVAEANREVIGYVNLHVHAAGETAWVADLAVDKNRRQQGIATRLLHEARAWARERGLRRLVLEAATKNYPALRFAHSLGLAFCGYNDLYYSNRDIAVFFGQSL